MKQLESKSFFLFLLISLASCQSSYVMTVETQRPPSVLFPLPVNGIVVVNNAVPQPAEYGVTLLVNKKEENKKQELAMDTALWCTVSTLAQTIEDANFYDKTYIYNTAIRHDDEWLSLNPLSQQTCDSIYREAGCNVIISIDRLLLNMNQAVVTSMEGYFIDPAYVFLYIQNQTAATCSVYLSEREKRLTSFSIQDTLFFNSTVPNDSMEIYKNIPNLIAKETAMNIGEKIATYFTPTWETASRLMYSSLNSRMQEADRYFKNHKWAQARLLWEQELEKKDKDKDKARICMNIAVTYEMEDRLDKALEWVQQSNVYYAPLKGDKIEQEKARNTEYVQVLNKRIHYNQLLDIQNY